jgi:hypothetical protein
MTDKKHGQGGGHGTVVPASSLLGPGVKTVTMNFKKKMHFTLQNMQRVEFLPGVQEIPKSILYSWKNDATGEMDPSPYVLAHAELYTPRKTDLSLAVAKGKQAPTAPRPALTDVQKDFLRQAGYNPDHSPEWGSNYVNNLSEDAYQGFLRDAAGFEELQVPADEAEDEEENPDENTGGGDEPPPAAPSTPAAKPKKAKKRGR